MKLLFSSMFLYEYSTDMIARAAEISGYDGVEFWIETPHYFIDRNTLKLECFRGMKLAIHAPVIDLNPVSVNLEIAEVTLRENLNAISTAAEVGADPVTIHAGRRSAAREPVWADYLSLHKFLRIVGRYGRIKGVTVSLENSEYGTSQLCRTAEEVYNFIEEYDLTFTFDIKHALRNGRAERFIELLFDRTVNVHVSYYDSKNRHVSAVNSEEVAEILRTLSDMGYSEILTVELDDLGIGKLDFKKKVEILRREADFIERFF